MTSAVADAAALVGRRLGGLPPSTGVVLADADGLRTVVHLDWDGEGGVVAKRYIDDAGRRTDALQRELHAYASRAAGALGVPEPLFYDAQARMAVQRHVDGTSLAATLADERDGSLAVAGRAVAELHALEIPAPEAPATVDDHIAALMRPTPARLARHLPALADRIRDIVSILRVRDPGPVIGARPIHRDLHPRQMIVERSRTWIVDWDLAAWGDPALDVGNFCAWLETHLDRTAAMRCRDRFLEGYTGLAGDGVLSRVDMYRGLTFLRLACKRYRLGRSVETDVTPMLAAAEEALR